MKTSAISAERTMLATDWRVWRFVGGFRMPTCLGRSLVIANSLAWLGLPDSSRAEDAATRGPRSLRPILREKLRVAYLRTQMQQYQIRDAAGKVLPLHESMGLRWTNPVSGVVDGGVFVWTDGECPVVVAKCYVNESQGIVRRMPAARRRSPARHEARTARRSGNLSRDSGSISSTVKSHRRRPMRRSGFHR